MFGVNGMNNECTDWPLVPLDDKTMRKLALVLRRIVNYMVTIVNVLAVLTSFIRRNPRKLDSMVWYLVAP